MRFRLLPLFIPILLASTALCGTDGDGVPHSRPEVASVSVQPGRVVAGKTVQGTVTLNGTFDFDIEVSLGLSSNEIGSVPRTVKIPAGKASATFDIVTDANKTYFPVEAYTAHVYANYNVTRDAPFIVLSTIPPTCDGTNSDYCTDAICYTCVLNEPDVPDDLLKLYRHEAATTKDRFLLGDSRFVLWRATGIPDCGALDDYRFVAGVENKAGVLGNFDRKLAADAVIGFSSKECGQPSGPEYQKASVAAKEAKRKMESEALAELARGTFKPQFGDVDIQTSIVVPAGSTTMILGNSKVALMPGFGVGTQVERVSRNWMDDDLPWWMLGHKDLNPEDIIMGARSDLETDRESDTGEGEVVGQIAALSAKTQIEPLTGTLIARHKGQWYAPDENGVFRFVVLDDKVQYPTTHVDGDFGWIIDTHGISALVSQALEFKEQVVIGCGDAVGKAKAAYYLSQKGISVVMPADRYEYLLLGYTGKGTILGTAPVHDIGGNLVIGFQPVEFSLDEPFVVEDTKELYPLQYYDAGARYFRALTTHVPLHVTYVEINKENQLSRVLTMATATGSTAIAVRIKLEGEDAALREWLNADPHRRAILFHSGLYPYAQGLFRDYPTQVTFGDLHPLFTDGKAFEVKP